MRNRREILKQERRLRLAQELRTIKREGVAYLPKAVTLSEWKARLRDSVRRRCGDTGLYGVAETAVCLYAMERDGARYDAAIRAHIGATKAASGLDPQAPYRRLAKWKRKAQAAVAKGAAK